MEEMISRMAQLLARVLEEPELVDTVTADTSLVDDLGVDSLHMITFLLGVEEEFDVEIDFESLELAHLESMKAFCHFALGTAVR